MMMALGLFVFSLRTTAYTELQRAQSWRHPSTERVGARAAHQFVGPGEDTITLQGLIAPPVTGDLASLDELRALADAGDALPLVDGTGRVLGAWVITDLQETGTLHHRDGTPRRVEFSVTLRHVDDAQLLAGR